ncbi:DUF3253 domain-containing protein [Arthrobacter sp. MDT2-16]
MPEQSSEDGLRAEILRIAEQRGSVKTLCPSEAARSIGGDTWRDLMPSARRIAFALAGEGLVDVTQHGERVDPDVRGPIRIRWISRPEDETGSATDAAALPAVGAPALRALHQADYRTMADLEGVPEGDLAALHGVGPTALRLLREELARRENPGV